MFDDPTTGKKGVKNPASQILVPAEYDAFTFIGDHNIFNINHMAAQKDGIKMGSFSLIHSTSSTMKTTKTTRNRMSRIS